MESSLEKREDGASLAHRHIAVVDHLIDGIILGKKDPYLYASEKTEFTKQQVRTIAKQEVTDTLLRGKIQSILDASDVERIQVVEEFKKIAFSNISDLVDLRNGELFYNDWSDIPPEVLAAVGEVSTTEGKYGTNIKLKMLSKTEALAQLVKLYGMASPEKIEHSGELTLKPGIFG